MLAEPIRAGLIAAFEQLDHETIRELEEEIPQGEALDDQQRIILAFGHLATGDFEGADHFLNEVSGDGTSSLADFAYVRAFRREIEGDFTSVVEMLRAHWDHPKATHSGRMRLRAADALLKLRRYDEIRGALGHLLEPPGARETLEAALIYIECLLDAGAEKEKLIEWVSLVDALIERGFRLAEAGNVVYYARLLDQKRIEPPVGPLLRSHEGRLDSYETEEENEILFLLAAGDKHKAPAAVRAAGRSYAKNPFKWPDLDPEKAAYLFASHEEHEAARETIHTCFSKTEIQKNQDLWGPLILESYHSGHWKEALELLRQHRQEISKLPMAAHALLVRAVCEYQLKRYEEALAHFEEFHSQEADVEASGEEIACQVLALVMLGRMDEIAAKASDLLRLYGNSPGFADPFLTTVLNELLIRRFDRALEAWLEFLPTILPEETRALTLARLGEVMIDWGWPRGARQIAGTLSGYGEESPEQLLLALAASADGHDDQAERHFAAALEEPAPLDDGTIRLHRARHLRRAGRLVKALEDLERILARQAFSRRHVAMAMKAGVFREQRVSAPEIDEMLKQAGLVAREQAQSPEEYTLAASEIRQIFHGESPEVLLRRLRHLARRFPGSLEVLRLARFLSHHPRADGELRREAASLEAEWNRENLA